MSQPAQVSNASRTPRPCTTLDDDIEEESERERKRTFTFSLHLAAAIHVGKVLLRKKVPSTLNMFVFISRRKVNFKC
jgi:hypothetical protein